MPSIHAIKIFHVSGPLKSDHSATTLQVMITILSVFLSCHLHRMHNWVKSITGTRLKISTGCPLVHPPLIGTFCPKAKEYILQIQTTAADKVIASCILDFHIVVVRQWWCDCCYCNAESAVHLKVSLSRDTWRQAIPVHAAVYSASSNVTWFDATNTD